jgi:DNA repair protein RAD16
VVYRHVFCATFSEEILDKCQVDGYETLSEEDQVTLQQEIERSLLEVQQEKDDMEPDELGSANAVTFQGELRPAPIGLDHHNITLLPFQVEGHSWMYAQETKNVIRGGILADEMGMGKTLQTIAVMCDNRSKLQQYAAQPNIKLPPDATEEDRSAATHEEGLWSGALQEWKHEMDMHNVPPKVSQPPTGRTGRGGGTSTTGGGPPRGGTLVICPVIALSQWKAEIEKFCGFSSTANANALTVVTYHGPNRASDTPLKTMLGKYDVVLTTYQVVEADFRKLVSPNKVTCPNCGQKFKIDKLRVHLKYFCGEYAERTEAQSRQKRSRAGPRGGGGGGGGRHNDDDSDSEEESHDDGESESEHDDDDNKKKGNTKSSGGGKRKAVTPSTKKKMKNVNVKVTVSEAKTTIDKTKYAARGKQKTTFEEEDNDEKKKNKKPFPAAKKTSAAAKKKPVSRSTSPKKKESSTSTSLPKEEDVPITTPLPPPTRSTRQRPSRKAAETATKKIKSGADSANNNNNSDGDEEYEGESADEEEDDDDDELSLSLNDETTSETSEQEEDAPKRPPKKRARNAAPRGRQVKVKAPPLPVPPSEDSDASDSDDSPSSDNDEVLRVAIQKQRQAMATNKGGKKKASSSSSNKKGIPKTFPDEEMKKKKKQPSSIIKKGGSKAASANGSKNGAVKVKKKTFHKKMGKGKGIGGDGDGDDDDSDNDADESSDEDEDVDVNVSPPRRRRNQNGKNKKTAKQKELELEDMVDMDALMKQASEGCRMSPLHGVLWWRVVLDEAHFIKSRTSQTTAACFALTGVHRWALSGTPLQNRVGEFYSLIRFLRIDPMAHYMCRAKDCTCKSLHYRMFNGKCQDCNHSSIQHFSHFNKYVLNPIQRDGYSGDGRRAMFILKNEVLDKALLRRTKESRAADMNLPPRLVTVRYTRMHPIEEDFYNALYTQGKSSFDDFVEEGTLLNNYAHIFDLLMRMRQAVDHPYLVRTICTVLYVLCLV